MSNKPFGRWGEVFGDATVAAAMIDRLVHHAEVLSLKGESYRLKDRDVGVPAAPRVRGHSRAGRDSPHPWRSFPPGRGIFGVAAESQGLLGG